MREIGQERSYKPKFCRYVSIGPPQRYYPGQFRTVEVDRMTNSVVERTLLLIGTR